MEQVYPQVFHPTVNHIETNKIKSVIFLQPNPHMFKHLQNLQWNKLHTEKVSQVCKTHLVQEKLYSQISRKTEEYWKYCARFMKGFNLCGFFASSAMFQTQIPYSAHYLSKKYLSF